MCALSTDDVLNRCHAEIHLCTLAEPVIFQLQSLKKGGGPVDKGNIIKFKQPSRRAQADGKTLCKSGFHKW
jgi:hypothetical protein